MAASAMSSVVAPAAPAVSHPGVELGGVKWESRGKLMTGVGMVNADAASPSPVRTK